MKLKEHFHNVIIENTGILDTDQQGMQSTLTCGRHGVRSRLIHGGEDGLHEREQLVQIIHQIGAQSKVGIEILVE